jgi:hypothetical protein
MYNATIQYLQKSFRIVAEYIVKLTWSNSINQNWTRKDQTRTDQLRIQSKWHFWWIMLFVIIERFIVAIFIVIYHRGFAFDRLKYSNNNNISLFTLCDLHFDDTDRRHCIETYQPDRSCEKDCSRCDTSSQRSDSDRVTRI